MEQVSALKLPTYQSHKTVRAAKIVAIETLDTGQGVLAVDVPSNMLPDGVTAIHVMVTSAYLHKHQPQIGGYYVLYEDGYESWSPAEAFEEGYAPVVVSVKV